MNRLHSTSTLELWNGILLRFLALASAGRVSTGIVEAAVLRDPPPPAVTLESSGASAEGEIEKPFYIRQYRVKGARQLGDDVVGAAVYPFMGPECTTTHIEGARTSLEKAYKDAGYSTVSVTVPQQEGKHGVVYLQVVEGRIGQLRVKGSRYFRVDRIKSRAPELAPGRVPNFNLVTKEILALNKHPDRQVTPTVSPGIEPGVFDVDLTVKDKFPLHGTLELNNRHNTDTTPLRINGSLSYSNLWQAGHTAGISVQVAPERPSDATVYSGYYIMPVPDVDWLSLMFTGTKQDSNINTLGGAAVAGRGHVLGVRANMALPPGKSYYHSWSFGVDFKHFDEDLTVGETLRSTPIEYSPFSASYNGTHVAKKHSTDMGATVTFNPRGIGSDGAEFDSKRYKSDGNFIHFRGDVAHTHDLPGGFEIYSKVQGQASDQPLINSEQFAAGGLGTARGYLEATVLGDNSIFGSLELRSPSLIGKHKGESVEKPEGEPAPENTDEWRFYGFLDAGFLSLHEPLPEQDATFRVASIGAGTRFKVKDHYNGSVDFGLPLFDAGPVSAGDWLVSFRLWTDF